MDRVARRLELLKLEGLGFSRAEVVNELSQKAACSKRAVYRDFENRCSWQPTLQSAIDPDEILMKVFNRYEQIYRQASLRLMTVQGVGAAIRCCAAIYQDKPIAFIAVARTRMKSNHFRVSRLVVLPDYQGIGVGNAS